MTESQLLPPGWSWTTLQDVTSPRAKKMQPKDLSGAPFIGLQHIEAHTMKLLEVGQTDKMKSAGSYFESGDVLYGRLRPYLNKIHEASFTGLASGEFIVFQEHDHLDNAFLKYFLNQVEFVSYATRLNTGDRPRIDFDQLASYPILLPPLNEQRRIVAEIEKQFTRLDASVASLKRMQANLKRYRASVLKAACEGRLVPTEAELARAEGRDYEPADQLLERILAERRERWESQEKRRGKYKEPASPDTSKLPDLPEGWVWATLETLMDIIRGLSFPKEARSFEPNENSIACLRTANVQDQVDWSDMWYIPERLLKSSRQLVRETDVLMSVSNSLELLGKVAYIKDMPTASTFGAFVNILRTGQGSDPLFLFFQLAAPEIKTSIRRAGSTTTNISNITSGRLAQIPVRVPPLAEQHRIVAEVERRLSLIQKAEDVVEANLKKADRLRQSILKQAFSGRLAPQDPDDEPASALLERIRAEREAAEAAEKNERRSRRGRGKGGTSRKTAGRENKE